LSRKEIAAAHEQHLVAKQKASFCNVHPHQNYTDTSTVNERFGVLHRTMPQTHVLTREWPTVMFGYKHNYQTTPFVEIIFLQNHNMLLLISTSLLMEAEC